MNSTYKIAVDFWRKQKRLVKCILVCGFQFALKTRGQKFTNSDLQIQPKGILYPFLLRKSSSDLQVFFQIFVEEEYKALGNLKDVRLIIDAGANVGYSSIYFLNKFPNSHLVAIEPDPNNFKALIENLSPYCGRFEAINSGLWSHATRLSLRNEVYRDGLEWSKQVQECINGDMEAVGIQDIISRSGLGRVSILKVDIEGAEAIVFSNDVREKWLGKIDAIAIELHDDTVFGKASDVFYSAIGHDSFEISYSGELTICKRKLFKD